MALAHRMTLASCLRGSRSGLLRRLCLRLRLGLLSLGRVQLTALILAAAPAAPMPFRLSLAIGRDWLQFRLGLRQFCRHACTSWHFAIGCIALLGSVVCSPNAEIGAELHFACRLSSLGRGILGRQVFQSFEDIGQTAS